jgi:ribose transport system ATP-binding protein
MPEPLLEMKGITKSFGGNVVLSDVDLTLWPREVHALVGENGAGNSTLMKILAGVYSRDAGSIRLEGRELGIGSPHHARRAGISMIFQEHTLAPHLTVAANIFLGMEPQHRSFVIDNREAERRAGEVLRRQGFPLNPSTPVRRLLHNGIAQQRVQPSRHLTFPAADYHRFGHRSRRDIRRIPAKKDELRSCSMRIRISVLSRQVSALY